MRSKMLPIAAVALIGAAGSSRLHGQTPLGTAFTFQGQLNENGSPINDPVDLECSLYDSAVGGASLGTMIESAVPVTDGLFNVLLDFGAIAFNGEARWLHVEVRYPASTGPWVTLSPRQPLTVVPYALQTRGMFVDENLNVGIGTVEPLGRLHVAGGNVHLDSNARLEIDSHDGWTFNMRYDAETGTGHLAAPARKLEVTSGWPEPLTLRGGQGGIRFNIRTASDNDATMMVVAEDGDVGIGTDAPAGILDVQGPNGGDIFFGVNDVGSRIIATDAAGNLNLRPRVDGAGVFARDGNTPKGIRLYGGGVNRIQSVDIDGVSPFTLGINAEGGRVGIGTDNPQAALHVGGTAGADGIMFPDGTLQTTAGGGGGGLTLPYSGSASSMVPAFSVSNSGIGHGIQGTAANSAGVFGETPSDDYPGVWGRNTGTAPAVAGTAAGNNNIGVHGAGVGSGDGVYGVSGLSGGAGVRGETSSPAGWGGYFVGRVGIEGTLTTYNNASTKTVEVMGQAYGDGSQINLKDSSSATRVQLTAANSELKLYDDTGVTRIRLDGVTGRTVTKLLEITGGSDLSERFNVTGAAGKAKPGLVVCIDPASPGELIVSTKAYDRAVAGVISGAGGVSPGLLMSQRGTIADGERPIALTGRVYCWVDAAEGPIVPGDLLTTSDIPGHAMKATDHTKAQGAILGKAMSSLEAGQRGLVLALVALQ